MMIYDIADLRIEIRNRYPFTTDFCKQYLSCNQQTKADIVAEISAEDFEEERSVSVGFSDGYIENICLYRNICKQMPSFNRILLHASVLQLGGDAYAFLGRSGTGKSTHSRLWLKYLKGISIVNGDKPILAIENGVVTAYGTPWMGKEKLGENTKAPLKGLCFLKQAKENKIVKLTAEETVTLLFQQLLLPSDEDMAVKTLELADQLIRIVPAYLLCCDISEEAVKTSFEAMTGKEYAANTGIEKG